MELITTPHFVVALMSLGLGTAFVVADPHTISSRLLAIFLGLLALAIFVNIHFSLPLVGQPLPPWAPLLALVDTLCSIMGFEWIARLRRMLPSNGLRTRFGDNLIRVAQGLALFYLGLSIAFPAERIDYFVNAGQLIDKFNQTWFWVFAAPIASACVLTCGSTALLLRRDFDQAERGRLISVCLSIPVFAAAIMMPYEYGPLLTLAALFIILLGALNFHVQQGRRAEFLGRFVSPQVAHKIQAGGLQAALGENQRQLSVVICDMRGFTAYTRSHTSQEVLEVLKRYYQQVGTITAAAGGTIKDHSGDGLLILVGAPVSLENHAERAMEIAQGIRQYSHQLSKQNKTASLAIGVGVASGEVTVGAIEGAGHMEYVAVGDTVNLAARLCNHAKAGQILVDEACQQQLAQPLQQQLLPHQQLQVKGIEQAIAVFEAT